MGTRADFYVGRGADAEWVGSVAFDGYPDNGDYTFIWASADERDFRGAVGAVIAARDDGTFPEHGWPWPWEDSHTTDWAYAFDGGAVWASAFGRPWIKVADYLALDADGRGAYEERPDGAGEAPVFPDMTAVQKVNFGRRSGVTRINFAADGRVEVVDDKSELDEHREGR